MQIMIAFVLLFSLLTVGLAAKVTIYDFNDYFLKGPENVAAVLEPQPQLPYKFVYKWRLYFSMHLIIKIKSPSVTLHNITSSTDYMTRKAKRIDHNGKEVEYYTVSGKAYSADEIKIKLNINKSMVLCSSLLVAEGEVDSTVIGEHRTGEPYNQICRGHCMLEVYLTDECDDFVLPSSQNFVFIIIYVIASVIGICVIILVMYLSFKKYRKRNSDRVDAIELNTYATANEVLYADLSLAHGDSQPPKREEESPYAQIIGVMKPVDG